MRANGLEARVGLRKGLTEAVREDVDVVDGGKPGRERDGVNHKRESA